MRLFAQLKQYWHWQDEFFGDRFFTISGSNPKARKFWERMGFSFEAEVIQVLPFGENRVSRLHKLLSQPAATSV
ncbi:hypothetical protein [Nostoc sp.]|uniref:hypothetical protein n=1 Tax=Nostoc sp. TaxID=1180 RepID=UPI002FF78CD3